MQHQKAPGGWKIALTILCLLLLVLGLGLIGLVLVRFLLGVAHPAPLFAHLLPDRSEGDIWCFLNDLWAACDGLVDTRQVHSAYLSE